MVNRVGGLRRKTRHKLSKSIREKSKLSLTRYFQTFDIGDRVVLKAEPSIQTGMYMPRFHGKTGVIVSKAGRCYNIKIQDFNKEKVLIVHPVHLKKA